VTDTRDPHPTANHDAHSLHSPASETSGSHLAHWPPRQRGHEHKPVHVKLHQPAESIPHPKPHGLGLTRSLFADDGDE
jgi:hypothetical protein